VTRYEGSFGGTRGRVTVSRQGAVFVATPYVFEGDVATPITRMRGGSAEVRADSEENAVQGAALVLEARYGPRQGQLQRVE